MCIVPALSQIHTNLITKSLSGEKWETKLASGYSMMQLLWKMCVKMYDSKVSIRLCIVMMQLDVCENV